MRGWSLKLVAFFVVVASLAFGQVGNGTITGVVTDQAGAVVAGATVEAKNSDTGVVFSGATSNAGNYTITDLPVGRYSITVTVKGFKTYTHTNLEVGGAQTLREDAALQVGNTTEAVTVTAESTLLKTESAELAHNVTITQIDELPLMGIGVNNSGTSGYRNPYNVVEMLPGAVNYNAMNSIGLNVNGLTVQSMLVDGQEATTRALGIGGAQYYQIGQMNVDAIQEVSYQTSNYAPEYGTASSVVINQTMKSGTNIYHGSGFDYFVNEDLNAGEPFSISGCLTGLNGVKSCNSGGGDGGKYQPRERRNDFGGTLGGPVVIPKIYNGRNKTFWFFSYEQYAETDFYQFTDTVAVPAYIGGNFSAISPNGGPGGCSLCATYGILTTALGTPKVQLDPLGNQMFANEIYDPLTRGVTSTGQGYAMPFLNNSIPLTRFSPLTVELQNLISKLGVNAQDPSLIGNYTASIPGVRYSAIPSIKIDHNIDAKDKLSFFYSENNTVGQISSPLGNADGLPAEIGGYRGTFIPTWTYRLNYDRTLLPTLLLHLGGGYIRTTFSDRAPFLSFNPNPGGTLGAGPGLVGFIQHREFPYFSGMSSTSYGGMQAIGTAGQGQSYNAEGKQTYTANLTWIRGKHTFKFGGNLVLEGVTNAGLSGVLFTTGIGPTSEPFAPTQSFNGFTTGFGYASWLLGDYSGVTQNPYTEPRSEAADWSAFAQDSWKVTRKLTLDYGLRWDLFGRDHEEYGRWGQFSETVPNANAGGHPGSTIFASNCNCTFYQPNYPFAFAPRLGVAYQINPKTVFRAGWGFTYALVESAAGSNVSTAGTYPLAANSPSYVPTAGCGGLTGTTTQTCQFVNDQTPGWIYQPTWPVSTNIYPTLGTTSPAPNMPDANQNRPPRVNQWSAGFQREITRSFVMEASYVANRAAWISGFLGGGTLNHVSPATYAQYGLYPYPGTGPAGYNFAPAGLNCVPGNDCARAILSQSLSSTAVQQTLAAAGIPNGGIPYACAAPCGFALSNPLSSIVGRPFPQFGAIGPGANPTGNSKYDSLQVKATKRYAHGLQAGGFFTWAQGFTRAVRQDYFNPASNQNALMAIPPRVLSFNFIYTTPKAQYFANHAKFVNTIIKDWQVGGFASYQSGAFLAIPATATAEFLPTQDVYVKGQPLYTPGVNLNNLGTYNPYSTQVLNPAAWAQCPVNSNCGDSGNDFLKNFRGPRHPTENANFGRNFRIKERYNFQVRAEFTNIFNRTLMPAPSTTSPQNPVAKNGLGILTGGYGVVNAYQGPNTAGIFAGTASTGMSGFGGATGEAAREGTIIARFSF